MKIEKLATVVLSSTVLAACAGDPAPPPEIAEANALRDCPGLGRQVAVRDGKIVLEDDMVVGRAADVDEVCAAGPRVQPRSIYIDGSGPRWPGGEVPFTIHPDLPDKSRVHEAIAHWKAKTTIDFVPRTNEADFVEFTNDARCHADLGRVGGKQHVWLSSGKDATAIRGIAIARDDRVYTWYADGMVSAGTSTDLDSRRAQYAYALPAGYHPDDIVEIAIAADDRVYTWYEDRKVSVGTSDDLAAHEAPHGNYQLPGGRTPSQIRGIAIGDGDQVYAWYSDGTRSKGHSLNLAADEPPESFSHHPDLPNSHIVGMDIASTDWVYVWYRNAGDGRRLTAGQSRNLTAHIADPRSYSTPEDCDTAVVIHEIGHTLGLKHEQSRCDRDDHVNVYYGNIQPGREGNFDTECWWHSDHGSYDFDSVMHYTSYVFSTNGSPTLLQHGTLGAPVAPDVVPIDSAIASDDHVYTWWSDGTVTAGVSSNLEFHRSRYPFSLPSGYAWDDIVGIAIARSSDRVYTWYLDGRVSVGTTSDLDAHVAPYAYDLPGNRTPSQIVAIGIASGDRVYAWYSDGKASQGTSDDLGSRHAPYDYVFESGYDRRDVVGIDISSQDVVYTWHRDGMASRGTSSNLGAHGDPYPFRGRGLLIERNTELSQGDVAAIQHLY